MERNSDNYACLYCVYIDHMNECDMLFILQYISVSSIILSDNSSGINVVSLLLRALKLQIF